MTVNRKKFFTSILPTPLNVPRLVRSQVVTLDAILDDFEARKQTDLRFPAYKMATALRECGINLAPVREGFSKSDVAARAYVKRHRYAYARPAGPYGHVYYGRGLVQLTWLANYQRMTELARKAGHDVDFVKNPDLVLEPKWAIWVMSEGMERAESFRGDFTGKAMEDYFNDRVTDWYNARRIVNGTDHAAEIAGNAKQFYADLVEASA